jgi:hypothetical protein
MTRQRISNKRMREMERLVHLTSAALLVTVVYAPWNDSTLATTLVRFVVFPVLVASGMAMWQFPRVRRWLRLRADRSERHIASVLDPQ